MQDRCQNTDRKSKDERNAEKGRGYIRSTLEPCLCPFLDAEMYENIFKQAKVKTESKILGLLHTLHEQHSEIS